MFERFTDRARRVLVHAQDEARLLDHNFIGTEHLLLGLLDEKEGVAAIVLRRLGIGLEPARQEVMELVRPGLTPGTGRPPFTPRAKKVLELSLRQALQLGHNYIGTEHLLLGLVAEGEGVGAQVVVALGADTTRVRSQVLEVLGCSPAADPPQSPALVAVLRRARRLAGATPTTTGHVLVALTDDAASQAAQALANLGVTADDLERRLAEIPLESTSDAPPRPKTVEITIGDATTSINDPDLVRMLDGVSAEEIRSVLRNAFEEAEADTARAGSRFGPHAQRVMQLARDEARIRDDNHVGTEHVLLGLLAEPVSSAGGVLISMGITREVFIAQLADEAGHAPAGDIPLTPRASRIIMLAGEATTGPVSDLHLLIGVIAESGEWDAGGRAGPHHLRQAAETAGVTLEGIRQAVQDRLGSSG